MTADDRSSQTEKAVSIALAGIRQFEKEPDAGTLEQWRIHHTADGAWLEVVFRSVRHDGRRVCYDRVIWPSVPDKDPETSGMIFGAVFQERVITGRPREAEAGSRFDLVL